MTSFSADERQLLDESLQSFLSEEYGFERWQKLSGFAGGQDGLKEWSQYAELGWLGVAIPEEYGGTGGGMTELAIVMAADGKHMVLEGLLGTLVLGAAAIERAGSAEQKAEFLPKIVEGNLRLAFCHTETDAGYARDYVNAVAQPVADGYIIEGTKAFALGAHCADFLLVSARIGTTEGPVGLFLVAKSTDGVSFNIAPALDARLGAEVNLAAFVGKSALLGETHDDRLSLIDQLIDRGAIAVCAEACGAMTEATTATIEYLKLREQFGQPLSKFQVLQHRLVDMSLSCEEARAIVHAALEAIDTGNPAAQRSVWHAKVQTAQSARFVGSQSLQLHGGIGMTDELKAGHLYKRLSVCEAMFGDADWYLGKLSTTLPEYAGRATPSSKT
ncbi:acyl-CoA dehydrogenase family protein [Brucella cytisi]|uniref:acyl-CoA dehydrogenase family protein n=1 Tax=Brucella cytisi TaxID=407152 RepID=UPI0035DA0C78